MPDKTEALRNRGYVELSGDDAVNFLIGNTVAIKNSDQPKHFPKSVNDRYYYFSDAHTAYVCASNDCWTAAWKVDGKEICFEFPERCDDPTSRFFAAPRLFKAPRQDARAGKIGVYLTFKSVIHTVVRGNATIAPLLDVMGMGKIIGVKTSDFAQEIEASSKFSGGDKQVPVSGTRAISFLMGNTFISGETAADEHGDIRLCPRHGEYYSPDGRIIAFTCHHWPDQWSMHITHWKMASGKLCIEDPSGDGTFGCGDRFEKVYLMPSERPDEWHVSAEPLPHKLIGHTGNIFNFR